MAELTGKQEKFARAVVKNGGDKVAAYKAAGYSMNGNTNTISKQSDKLFNDPKINPRIKYLQKESEKKFTISVEQRLRWLEEITKAGLGTYLDQQGNERREGLTAAKGAIETLNNMLGVDEDNNTVKPVKVFVGVVDAS